MTFNNYVETHCINGRTSYKNPTLYLEHLWYNFFVSIQFGFSHINNVQEKKQAWVQRFSNTLGNQLYDDRHLFFFSFSLFFCLLFFTVLHFTKFLVRRFLARFSNRAYCNIWFHGSICGKCICNDLIVFFTFCALAWEMFYQTITSANLATRLPRHFTRSRLQFWFWALSLLSVVLCEEIYQVNKTDIKIAVVELTRAMKLFLIGTALRSEITVLLFYCLFCCCCFIL